MFRIQMNYFYLQWDHKRPSVCVFTDIKPTKINIIHEVNIRGHKNIFEKTLKKRAVRSKAPILSLLWKIH